MVDAVSDRWFVLGDAAADYGRVNGLDPGLVGLVAGMSEASQLERLQEEVSLRYAPGHRPHERAASDEVLMWVAYTKCHLPKPVWNRHGCTLVAECLGLPADVACRGLQGVATAYAEGGVRDRSPLEIFGAAVRPPPLLTQPQPQVQQQQQPPQPSAAEGGDGCSGAGLDAASPLLLLAYPSQRLVRAKMHATSVDAEAVGLLLRHPEAAQRSALAACVDELCPSDLANPKTVKHVLRAALGAAAEAEAVTEVDGCCEGPRCAGRPRPVPPALVVSLLGVVGTAPLPRLDCLRPCTLDWLIRLPAAEAAAALLGLPRATAVRDVNRALRRDCGGGGGGGKGGGGGCCAAEEAMAVEEEEEEEEVGGGVASVEACSDGASSASRGCANSRSDAAAVRSSCDWCECPC